MKTMFKKNGKRVLSAALCLLMAVMSLPLSAFAWTSEEGRSCTSSFGDYYVGLDGEYYRSQATMHTLVYNDDGSTYVKSYSSGNAKRKYLMTDNSGTHQVYCVESGIDFNTGNTYTSKSGQNSSYFKNLPTDAQFGVMMALMYGWHEGKSSPVAGTNADDYAYATQSIIWEYQQQLRTSPADLHSANGIPADMYYSSIKGRPAEKCYNWILSQMADHYTIPSFAARNQSKANTYTLKYNPDTQKYSLTIEDTNNTLSNIKFSASGISVSRSGNKYTFTSDKMITSPVTVSAQKQVNLNTDDMLIWGCVGKQTMISGASDPVYFYFKIDTETYGTGHIKKTSEDGVVSGIKFNISGNGVNKTVTTKADGTVDIQLMLKITNDGRKLALDQRMIDPMLPDDPDSKVNACVDNVYRIWEEHADTKATQLVFCDLSTPKGDGSFNIYDDIRGKLTERGIPAEQVRFIHEATTDAQKKELFAKVRSGEVRVLLGSTPKMGAGTNVQDRLIAIHNLDCPWRPSDLEQRQGRIERQGNLFPEVEVYRYVTEQTFDAYLYQLVESKQKFISQIMTSKSPVRSAEDVDEVALSFAEVKMLATGDERFKEKMDLDIQVSKLRVLKQSYLSEHYDLEDRILQQFPKLIKEYEERIAGYEADTVLAEQHKSQGEDKFCPMTLQGVTYTEKADAGQMLLALCKENPLSKPTEIGSYRGFKLEVYYDPVNSNYCLNLCGKSRHKVELGSDALGLSLIHI